MKHGVLHVCVMKSGILEYVYEFIMSYNYLIITEIFIILLLYQLPSRVHEAMQMQVEAERRKRAAILESEGIREADINVAEGKRQSRILASGEFHLIQTNVT